MQVVFYCKFRRILGNVIGWPVGIAAGIVGFVITLPAGGIGGAVAPICLETTKVTFGRGLECILTGFNPVHEGEFN